jgi:hypothetical protein
MNAPSTDRGTLGWRVPGTNPEAITPRPQTERRHSTYLDERGGYGPRLRDS